MNLSRFIILSLLAVVILVACGNKPRSVLTEKEMVAVLQDLYIVDAMMKNRRNEFKSNESKDALINSVLDKHGITQAQLDSSLVWYADNISIYSEIHDTVSARLQKRSELMNELHQKSFRYNLTGFTTVLPEHYALDVNTPTFRFKIDSTRLSSLDKDKWRFSFCTQGIDTIYHRIESSVYFKYSDTLIIDKRKLVGDSLYIFNLPQRSDSLLKEISGYVHIVMATDKMPKVFMSDIRNMKADSIAPIAPLESLGEKDLTNTMLKDAVYK